MNITELYIMNFMRSIHINEPHQLSINEIATNAGVSIKYWEFSSEAVCWKGKFKIFLKHDLNRYQLWQEFGHEMRHVLVDSGRQERLPMLYVDFQEDKANYFAYHFCVPTFMLQRLKEVTVHVIMNLFNVEEDFAVRRLEMYQSKIFSRRFSLEVAKQYY